MAWETHGMGFRRHVVVLDAADIAEVSAFWAGIFEGLVVDNDPDFHCVVDAGGEWVIGVQRAPGHVPPDWPDGEPQQVHLDLHADDADAAHARAIDLGARLLQDADDPATDEGHRVYADPAGHPFCIGWGQPTATQLAAFLATWPGDGTAGG